MFVADLHSCEAFISGDNATLRELLHPDKEPLKLLNGTADNLVDIGIEFFRD